MIIVNGFPPFTIITKRSILDVAAALDSPLIPFYFSKYCTEIKSVLNHWELPNYYDQGCLKVVQGFSFSFKSFIKMAFL